MKAANQRIPGAPNYGRIARVYRWLEYFAFGRALQKSRETFLEQLRDCRSIAIFGGGDGRCFQPILRASPNAQIEAFDIDPVMIEFARRRVNELRSENRVNFRQVDARTFDYPPEMYDAVITHYFLDCFTEAELDVLIPKIARSLKPGALWIFADFSIPQKPLLAHWRARTTIALLCAFFRWQVQHPLRSLPPMESKLREYGFVNIAEKERSGRMVRTVLYQRDRSCREA